MVIVVDEIIWTGNLGSSILRVQQSSNNATPDSEMLDNALESLPQDGDFMAEGDPKEAVASFLAYSLTQIEAMIDLVRGDLDRLEMKIMLVKRMEQNLTTMRSEYFSPPTDVFDIGGTSFGKLRVFKSHSKK